VTFWSPDVATAAVASEGQRRKAIFDGSLELSLTRSSGGGDGGALVFYTDDGIRCDSVRAGSCPPMNPAEQVRLVTPSGSIPTPPIEAKPRRYNVYPESSEDRLCQVICKSVPPITLRSDAAEPQTSSGDCNVDVSVFSNARNSFSWDTSMSGGQCVLEIRTLVHVSPLVVDFLLDGTPVDQLKGLIGGPYGDTMTYRFAPGEYDAVILRRF